jgi:hypothetical protein
MQLNCVIGDMIHKFKFHVGKTQTYLLGGIIMLKKVMIICLAFSFVFIGGIAFALGSRPEAIKEGQESAPTSGDVITVDPTDLITDDSKTVIEEGFKLKEKVIGEGGDGQE